MKKYIIVFNKKKLDIFFDKIKKYDKEKRLYIINLELDRLKEIEKLLEEYKIMEE